MPASSPRRTRTPPPSPRGIIAPATASRGITAKDVDRAADALLREGQRPTIEKVRLKIGRGSPNTVNPLLDAWWSRLAGRLDAGPAALHRLPEPVLFAAEGLWLQSLEQARKRAAAEQGPGRTSLAKERQEMEVRAHVLAIRESELQGRLDAAERRTAALGCVQSTLQLALADREDVGRTSSSWRSFASEVLPEPCSAAARWRA